MFSYKKVTIGNSSTGRLILSSSKCSPLGEISPFQVRSEVVPSSFGTEIPISLFSEFCMHKCYRLCPILARWRIKVPILTEAPFSSICPDPPNTIYERKRFICVICIQAFALRFPDIEDILGWGTII